MHGNLKFSFRLGDVCAFDGCVCGALGASPSLCDKFELMNPLSERLHQSLDELVAQSSKERLKV